VELLLEKPLLDVELGKPLVEVLEGNPLVELELGNPLVLLLEGNPPVLAVVLLDELGKPPVLLLDVVGSAPPAPAPPKPGRSVSVDPCAHAIGTVVATRMPHTARKGR
jgi:hypothetical protein